MSPYHRNPASKRTSRGKIPSELTDAARGKRLQKVIAESGVASRRDAEKLIADGRVSVNGRFVTALPAWVDPDKDRIEVNGHPIPRPRKTARGGGAEHVYVVLNKPRRVISTSRDEAGRMSVVDMVELPEDLAKRVFPVGRLDADSTGLILLTNDGELANRLTHPRYGVTKEYLVSIRGHLTSGDVEKLKKGVFIATPKARSESTRADAARGKAGALTPALSQGERGKERGAKRASFTEVEFVGHERDEQRGDRTQLRVTLHEGQNR